MSRPTGWIAGVLAGSLLLSGMAAWAVEQGGEGKDVKRGPKPMGADRPKWEQRMKAMDTNGDKQVSLEEFEAFRKQETAKIFARMDTNGDGMINKQDRREPPKGAKACCGQSDKKCKGDPKKAPAPAPEAAPEQE